MAARRSERLDELKSRFKKDYNTDVLTICLDVQQKNAVAEAFASLPEEFGTIDLLINSAGLALGRDNFENACLEDWDTMMHTNVDGLLYVSKAALTYLLRSKTPHIVNICSIAGKEVYENGNIYCASKYAVDAISKAMRIDLLKHNIKVTSVNPGAVETEFSLVRYKGNQNQADATYVGLKPLSGADIADAIYYCATLPPHVCINEFTIMPTQQASALYFNKTT